MITRFVADLVTKRGGSPVFGDPSKFGLDHEDVTFQATSVTAKRACVGRA